MPHSSLEQTADGKNVYSLMVLLSLVSAAAGAWSLLGGQKGETPHTPHHRGRSPASGMSPHTFQWPHCLRGRTAAAAASPFARFPNVNCFWHISFTQRPRSAKVSSTLGVQVHIYVSLSFTDNEYLRYRVASRSWMEWGFAVRRFYLCWFGVFVAILCGRAATSLLLVAVSERYLQPKPNPQDPSVVV